MTADSQQVSRAGNTGSERWADERIQQRRSEPPKVIRRPPTSDALNRPSWWPVFWLLCLIVITIMMISNQISTTPTVGLPNLQESIAAILPERISSLISRSPDSALDQSADQSAEPPTQPAQDEGGPLAALRTMIANAFRPLRAFAVSIFTTSIFADNNQSQQSGQAELDGQAPTDSARRLVIADSFLEPTVSLASAAVNEQWVMDFLPDGSGIYRMRVWPTKIAWTSLGGVAVPKQFRLETTMQVNPLVPEGYGGFLARYQDDDNYYVFVVDGRGNYQVALRENGAWSITQQWSNKPAIHLAGDQQNVIALEDTHDLLRVYANDALLGEFEPTLPTGLTGFVSGTQSTQTAEVDYSGLSLYELP